MAENIQRSTGRPQEYRFDRGGFPAEMGPFVGIVVNNVDSTRSGRLQVWIEQFGKFQKNGSPDLTYENAWRTVRYISPFYGATQQSGANGVGTYPGNRNTYGMWFTPPELGTKVLCFSVSGDPSVSGYYVGCIPEDGLNRMIPAIGSVPNYKPNNSTQQQMLSGVPLAPVTETNDIDPKFTNDPRFFDKEKPVQSVVEAVLLQQGLNKDPIRGPIKSSAQRESPSNCYGISTPGKPIYQGGYNEKNIRSQLEQGKIKIQDIAVIGRQGGHTFVMDDGDIDGNDTLVRIRTAKGHQITMSDDGDAFYITHANGQTWIELGKAGTVDVYSTNSINLRTQGVLNFHADKGINMYSGGTFRIKSKKTAIIESAENLLLGSDQYTLLSSKQQLGISSDGTLALQSKSGSWKSDASLNFRAGVINLNGAAAASVAKMPNLQDIKLPDTKFVTGKGWVSENNILETIVSRAPTHEPFAGHGRGADVSINLNPINVTAPTSQVAKIYQDVSEQPVQKGLTLEALVAEPVAVANVGPLTTTQVTALTAQTAYTHSLTYPAYDDDGNLMPGFILDDETGVPYYNGLDIGKTGIGKYGQSVDSLVVTGFIKSGVLDLVRSGAPISSVLNSASSWTNQYGVGSLTDYLKSPRLQNIVQVGLAIAAFTGLTSSGAIQGNEDPRVIATLLQPATEYGVDDVVSWVDGFASSSDSINYAIAARQAQYAIDLVDYYSQAINPPGATEGTTAEREIIDQAVAEIIGNPKVPVPQYTDTPVELSATSDLAVQANRGLIDSSGTISAGTSSIVRVNNDGSIVKVDVPDPTQEDGTLRFASNDNQD
jgi:hypothetical protein